MAHSVVTLPARFPLPQLPKCIALLARPNTRTPSGRRDKIALGLCVAAGLRREGGADITAWGQKIGAEGLVLRSLGWGNRLGKGLTAVSLFRIVAKYGKLTIREYLYCQRP